MLSMASPLRRSRFKSTSSFGSAIQEDGTESDYTHASEAMSTASTLAPKSHTRASLVPLLDEAQVKQHRKALRWKIRERNGGPALRRSPAIGSTPGRSALDILSSSKYLEYINDTACFSTTGSLLDCVIVGGSKPEKIKLTDDNFSIQLDRIVGESSSTALTLAFFADVTPCPDPACMSRVSVSQQLATKLFSVFDIDSTFLPSFVGRPDYGAPCSRIHHGNFGAPESFSLSLQHPRWGVEDTGLPLSVYMRRLCDSNITIYIITAKETDGTVQALQNILMNTGPTYDMDALEIHAMISRLSVDLSKTHVEVFQRYTREKLEKLDDCFDPQTGLKDRAAIDALTKDLPVIAYNADAFIAAGQFASLNARKIRDLDQHLHVGPQSQISETLSYIIESMAKQRLSFESYKTRKDITMDLVSNLLAQEDVETSLKLAKDAKRDSSSMNVIALMTMIFLPGTFIANVLSANIFSATADSQYGITVSRIWWFWTAISIPLTICVVLLWLIYQRWPAIGPHVSKAGQALSNNASVIIQRLSSTSAQIPALAKHLLPHRAPHVDEEHALSSGADFGSRSRNHGVMREGSAATGGTRNDSDAAGSAGGQSTGMPSLRTGPTALSLYSRSSPRPFGSSTLSSGDLSNATPGRELEGKTPRFMTEAYRIGGH